MNGRNTRTCVACGGIMERCTVSTKFKINGKEIEIKGIDAYRCPDCGEEIYTAEEAKMIEGIMRAVNNNMLPNSVLNLEETAQYLRVSNQTVYNMIRDGRIKAYKVGREWRFLRGDIMAYMDSSSNTDVLAMAAKGGKISTNDLSAIEEALTEEDK